MIHYNVGVHVLRAVQIKRLTGTTFLRIEEKTMERRVTFYEETSFKTTEIGEIPADWKQ